jgi:chemotaxis protein MotB
MNLEEETPAGAPEWTVTYADLMSLLLTFFILLASMSEIRENDKYQGMADSLHEHFGQSLPADAIMPGETKPRSALFASLTLAGRAKRKSLLENLFDPAKDNAQALPRVRIVRPGSRTTVGTVVYFADHSTQLDAAAREDLIETAELLRGKPQKIEVRGHTSQQAVQQDSADAWRLAFDRAENTMDFLVNQLRIEPKRIRLSVAGAHEPASTSADPAEQQANTRVEVFLLDEVAPESLPGSRTASSNSPQRF